MFSFEETLVMHAAPTLAGRKIANLFCYRFSSLEAAQEQIEAAKRTLHEKGVELFVIRRIDLKHFIYLFRPNGLMGALQNEKAEDLLKENGYLPGTEANDYVEQLAERFSLAQSCPDEIGVFLGYPIEDVIGFMENKGANYCCCGCWKVYSNRQAAEKIFSMYRKLRSIYIRSYQKGRSVAQLTVVA